ncbi:hypothetical protein [Microbispora sp. H10949]|uniref:hypothetical protein n=1 Tax=Microbispora sp. H10949 TaxID=2729111 RepID=UPI0016016100|nr:hypothetical protein [Microbispora sp. H10949]
MRTTTTLKELQAAFPGWTIWRSSADRLWATRNRQLTDVELDHGLSHTIDGDDTHQLGEQLRDQEQLASELPPQ